MQEGSGSGKRSPLIALAAAGIVIAVTFFRVPLGSLLFLGILLLCPLLMMRMHGGGHDHEGTSRDAEDTPTRRPGNVGHRPGNPSSERWN